MESIIKNIIDRYKRIRSMRQLKQVYGGNYAFVGVGDHSTNNLYPVLNYLHVPLKYICCKSKDKIPLIEAAYPNVCATTSLADICKRLRVYTIVVFSFIRTFAPSF